MHLLASLVSNLWGEEGRQARGGEAAARDAQPETPRAEEPKPRNPMRLVRIRRRTRRS